MSQIVLFLAAVVVTVYGVTPIIIVPGLGGSVLEAQLNNRHDDGCPVNQTWYTIWASLSQATLHHSCFMDDLELVSTRNTSEGSVFFGVDNPPGVSIRPRDYGGTGGIEYSNAGTYEPPIAYMHTMVQQLEAVGYVAGVTLRAATNDFRALGARLPNGTDHLDLMFTRLQQLVEETSLAQQSKVHLLSHSLGGPVVNIFLNTFVSPTWKKQYIESHIMLSAPLLGTPVAIEAILSGPQYDWVPQFLPALAVPLIRTWPSVTWMWPRILDGVDVWAKDSQSSGYDRVFISTPSHNYTLRDLEALVKDVNASVLSDTWYDVNLRTKSAASDPNVKVLCLFANDTETDLHLLMPDDEFSKKKGKRVEWTWGDGTVSLTSLEACSRWKDVTVQPIEFGGNLAAHTQIVSNKQVLQTIIEWVK